MHTAAKNAVVLTVLAGCLFAGCSMDRWTKVEPGEYSTVRGTGTASKATAQEIQKVEIDRDIDTATFTLADGSRIVVSFVPRDSWLYPHGSSGHRQEHADHRCRHVQ